MQFELSIRRGLALKKVRFQERMQLISNHEYHSMKLQPILKARQMSLQNQQFRPSYLRKLTAFITINSQQKSLSALMQNLIQQSLGQKQDRLQFELLGAASMLSDQVTIPLLENPAVLGLLEKCSNQYFIIIFNFSLICNSSAKSKIARLVGQQSPRLNCQKVSQVVDLLLSLFTGKYSKDKASFNLFISYFKSHFKLKCEFFQKLAQILAEVTSCQLLAKNIYVNHRQLIDTCLQGMMNICPGIGQCISVVRNCAQQIVNQLEVYEQLLWDLFQNGGCQTSFEVLKLLRVSCLPLRISCLQGRAARWPEELTNLQLIIQCLLERGLNSERISQLALQVGLTEAETMEEEL